jgi:hypothetical protein
LGCVARFFEEGLDSSVLPLFKKELAPCQGKNSAFPEIM